MLMKVAFPSTIELDGFIGQLQQFGKTQTQIVFSTAVPPRGVGIETDDLEKVGIHLNSLPCIKDRCM